MIVYVHFLCQKKKKASGMSLDKLGLWIIVATVLGAAVGLIMGKPAHMFAPMGNLFMQLIKMVVVPLVLFSLIGGAASLGKSSSAGKIGVLTFIYYGITTAVSVMIALAFSELFKPGMGIDMAAISGATTKELMQFAGHSDIHVAMHYQEAVNDRERDSPNGWPRWACRTPARGDPSRWSPAPRPAGSGSHTPIRR